LDKELENVGVCYQPYGCDKQKEAEINVALQSYIWILIMDYQAYYEEGQTDYQHQKTKEYQRNVVIYDIKVRGADTSEYNRINVHLADI
jgi:hypothetical protein